MLDWTKGRAGVRRGVACALLLVTATACEQPEEASGPTAEEPVSGAFLSVYTVNYPLAWMAERLGGDAVSVSLPVPEGVDPAHWQPLPKTVLAYQGADVVLLNGAGYAGWVKFAALSPGRWERLASADHVVQQGWSFRPRTRQGQPQEPQAHDPQVGGIMGCHRRRDEISPVGAADPVHVQPGVVLEVLECPGGGWSEDPVDPARVEPEPGE